MNSPAPDNFDDVDVCVFEDVCDLDPEDDLDLDLEGEREFNL